MILQALKSYYDRKAADSDSSIAPMGWERKEIPYVLVLDREGRLVNVEDTQEKVGKKLRARPFSVPQSTKRSSNIKAYLMWDNVEYVTGVTCKGDDEEVRKKHEAFMQCLLPHREKVAVGIILKFLESPDVVAQLEQFPVWAEAKKTCAFLVFRLADADGCVFDDPEIKSLVNSLASSSGDAEELPFDFVSGERQKVALLHPALKGIAGANSMGANLVSFNLKASESFGKSQGENSPIGEKSAFEYTTALNTLLGKDSAQKMMVGDATTVFWAEKADRFEESMSGFFAEPPKDDPDRLQNQVRALFESPQKGVGSFDTDETKFYVLGLSPNAARLSVRFWHVGTVAEMSGRFRQYFDDLMIVHGSKDKDHISLWRLLVSTAVQGKSENIAPNLAGDLMRSILDGLPFPAVVLQSVLMRIKAEHEVSYPRAKLIKGYLNRKWRFNNPNHERNITVSLDSENTNIGYRLGRLFAVLEKVQESANPGINATIKDKFYASASSTPSTVFGNLMRLVQHHLSKIGKEKGGYRVFLEKLIQEIVGEVKAFPAHLSLEDQGQFAIGYYHQRQAFFVKKATEENADAE